MSTSRKPPAKPVKINFVAGGALTSTMDDLAAAIAKARATPVTGETTEPTQPK